MKETIKQTNMVRHQEMREKVMLLTGYSEGQMNQMIFDLAVDYMRGRGMCEDWMAPWLKEPIFWNWWRGQWTLIDEMFWYRYESYLGKDSVKPQLRVYYEDLHSNIDFFPDAIVYEKIHSTYELAGQWLLNKIRSEKDIS